MMRNILQINRLLSNKLLQSTKKLHSTNSLYINNENNYDKNTRLFFKYYFIISALSSSAFITYNEYKMKSKNDITNSFELLSDLFIYKVIFAGIIGPVIFPIITISHSYEYIKSIIKN